MTAVTERKASLVTCGHATDATEARLLLRMLGLLDESAPGDTETASERRRRIAHHQWMHQRGWQQPSDVPRCRRGHDRSRPDAVELRPNGTAACRACRQVTAEQRHSHG